MRNVVVITGPAGCGLSSAEFVFEELGFYVVKNAPSDSMRAIMDVLINKDVKNIAFVAHIRNIQKVVNAVREIKDINFRFILLNASEEELNKRFALTRNVHPRSVLENVDPAEAISRDIKDTLNIIPEADFYIDTTSLTVKNLRSKLYKYLANVEEDKITSINFISFGIKNGIPQGIDEFLDVRAIPNPYWVEELKALTGEDQKVIDYRRSFPITQEILDNITNYLESHLKEIQKTGRGSYTIGIACSGGQHRSTYVANYLTEYFSKIYRTHVVHRDIPAKQE